MPLTMSQLIEAVAKKDKSLASRISALAQEKKIGVTLDENEPRIDNIVANYWENINQEICAPVPCSVCDATLGISPRTQELTKNRPEIPIICISCATTLGEQDGNPTN